MSVLRGSATVLAAALAAAACSNLLAVAEAEAVVLLIQRVDHAEGSVSYRIENRAAETAYVGRCGEDVAVVLDREESAGGWTAVGSSACEEDVLSLTLPAGSAVADRKVDLQPGRFRLRTGVAFESDKRVEWTVTSDPFEIR